MLLKRIAGILLLLAVVFSLVTGSIAWRRGENLHSDAAAPRPSEGYDRLLAPGERGKGTSDDFANMIVDRSATEVTVRKGGVYPNQADAFVAKIHRASPGEPVGVEGGAMSLAAVGVGFAAPRTNFVYSVRVPARFYHPGLQLLSSNEVSRLVPEWEREVDFRGMFPSAKFVFARSNIAEMKLLGLRVFDARTHADLSDGSYSTSSDGNVFWYACDIGLWHQTPLEIFLTVAVGPTEVISAPARIDELISFPGGVFKLLGLLEGAASGSTSSYDGKTNRTTMRVRNPGAGRTETTAVFTTSPGGSGLPMDVEFLDRGGKVLRSTRSGMGWISSQGLECGTNEVAQVRLKYYPKVHRIVFRIPELPGLPEENRGLKNLFDVRIPYVRFEGEWQYQQAVGSLVQMSMPPVALNFTNAYFPLIRSNTTTRALFQDLNARVANPEEELRLNPAEGKVELRRSPVLVFLQQLRKLIPQ